MDSQSKLLLHTYCSGLPFPWYVQHSPKPVGKEVFETMADHSELAPALGSVDKDLLLSAKSEQGNEPIASPRSASPSTKRRRVGKRSDPEYSPTTFFIKKVTKRKAAQLLLEDANAAQDLSDLVEQLLAEWVLERSHF